MTIYNDNPIKSFRKVSFLPRLSFLIGILMIGSTAMAQRTAYDLKKLASEGLIKGENRSVKPLGDKKAVRVSEAEGYGVAWLNNVEFSNGTIEVDVWGKDLKQGSFLGIAFHGTTMDKSEAIYFRPFNFLATDSAQRKHMVQYVFEAEYGWERLRNEHPGVYENGIAIPPNPNDWFHVKIVVKGKSIKVYVNNATKPCLEVASLNQRTNGKLGLWVGNSSGGDFANLVVDSN